MSHLHGTSGAVCNNLSHARASTGTLRSGYSLQRNIAELCRQLQHQPYSPACHGDSSRVSTDLVEYLNTRKLIAERDPIRHAIVRSCEEFQLDLWMHRGCAASY